MRLEEGALSVEIDPVGAMLSDVSVVFPDGRRVKPFFRNPWRDEEGNFDCLTRHLSAEWPCVPFGMAGQVGGLPEDWQEYGAHDWNKVPHGFGACNLWDLEQISSGRARARIAYPADTPIVALEREVLLDNEASTIHLRLRIETREVCRVPIGVHPVFDLTGAAPRSCHLVVSGQDHAWSYPVDVEPGASRFAPDQRGERLSAMRAAAGGTVDGTKVPFEGNSEDLLLLPAPEGEVTLCRPDRGYAATVFWDAEALPCCALWYSNGGRRYAPWSGRVRAIGIEPMIGAFDLGQTHSLSERTPLAQAGIPTAARIGPEAAFEVNYGIRIAPLE